MSLGREPLGERVLSFVIVSFVGKRLLPTPSVRSLTSKRLLPTHSSQFLLNFKPFFSLTSKRLLTSDFFVLHIHHLLKRNALWNCEMLILSTFFANPYVFLIS